MWPGILWWAELAIAAAPRPDHPVPRVRLVLVLNLRRGDPLAAIGAALLLAALLRHRWVRAGRPGGVARVAVDA